MKTILLIDLSAIFRALWHANADGAVTVAYQGTLDAVRRCQSLYPGALVAICCDGKGNWRKALSADYKAQREKQPEQMYGLLDRVKTRLKQDGHLLWECEGFEADDVIATACEERIHDPTEPTQVVIASHDKDLLQLLAPGITQLRTHTWQPIDADGVKAKFGIGPHQFADWLALVGDKSDNIKGADGVGEKGAAELLIRFGGLVDIFDHVENDPVTEPYWRTGAGKPGALRPKLLASKDAVMLARKLVALRYDAPIKLDEIFEERKVEDLVADDAMPDAEFVDDVISTTAGKPADGYTRIIDKIQIDKEIAEKQAIETVATPQEQTQTLVRSAVPFELGLEPQSLAQATQLAAIVFNSRLYPKYPSEKAVLVAFVRGRELGVSAIASLDVFHWIAEQGKLAMHAHLIISLAESHPNCEYIEFRGGDATYAEYAFKRKDRPKETVFRYTIEDAVATGITTMELLPRTAGPKEKDDRGNWHKMRPAMLRKMCGVQGVRIVFPRAALGLYSLEEMGVDHE